MNRQLIIIGIIFLLLTVSLCGCSLERPNVDVEITNLYYVEIENETGRRLYLNVTFKNKGDSTIHGISLPYVKTDKGKIHTCFFTRHPDIQPYGVVNTTVVTWKSFPENARPKTFFYQYGGEVLPPASIGIDIPDYLTNS